MGLSDLIPVFCKQALAVDHQGEPLADGRGVWLLPGASNYYATFYGVEWLGMAVVFMRGAVINHLTGKKL